MYWIECYIYFLYVISYHILFTYYSGINYFVVIHIYYTYIMFVCKVFIIYYFHKLLIIIYCYIIFSYIMWWLCNVIIILYVSMFFYYCILLYIYNHVNLFDFVYLLDMNVKYVLLFMVHDNNDIIILCYFS